MSSLLRSLAVRPARWLVLAGLEHAVVPLLAARSLRAFADGFVAVLPAYLLWLGLGTLQVGILSTATRWLYRGTGAGAADRPSAAAAAAPLGPSRRIALPPVACGVLKTAYDLVLWRACRHEVLDEH